MRAVNQSALVGDMGRLLRGSLVSLTLEKAHALQYHLRDSHMQSASTYPTLKSPHVYAVLQVDLKLFLYELFCFTSTTHIP